VDVRESRWTSAHSPHSGSGACATPTASAARRSAGHAPAQAALLDAHLVAAAVGAPGGAREQLDLLAGPLHFGHDKAIQPDEAGSVVLRPLFLLAPRSLDHAKPQRGSGCLLSRSTPPLQQRPHFSSGLDNRVGRRPRRGGRVKRGHRALGHPNQATQLPCSWHRGSKSARFKRGDNAATAYG
jgi:hypothetical protein